MKQDVKQEKERLKIGTIFVRVYTLTTIDIKGLQNHPPSTIGMSYKQGRKDIIEILKISPVAHIFQFKALFEELINLWKSLYSEGFYTEGNCMVLKN